jgi:hypothetical protein
MRVNVARDTRKEERTVRAVPIRYSDTFLEGEEPFPPIHDGVTFDVSASGLSFRTYRPVEHMMVIRLTSDFLWKETREGVVRWCSKIYPGIYKVGISLI